MATGVFNATILFVVFWLLLFAWVWIFFQWPLGLPRHGTNVRSDQQRQKDSTFLYILVILPTLAACWMVQPLRDLFQTHWYLSMLVALTALAFALYGAIPSDILATNQWLFSYLPTLLLAFLFYRAFNERLYNSDLYFPKLAVLLLCSLALGALFLGLLI